MNVVGESTDRVVSDTGPFTIIPEWVLDADITPTAVRLYGVMGRFIDATGGCWPSRKTLAKRLRVSSPRTVDNALGELKDVGAVVVTPRTNPQTGQTSNFYRVNRVQPVAHPLATDCEGGVAEDCEGPLATNCAQNESHGEREPVEREPLFAEEQISDPPEDQLHHRLCKVCTGPKVTVAVEGLRVLLIGREFFADHVIDEAIGVCELLDIPPRLPRYLLRVLQDRASETGQHIPDLFERFEDAGRTA